MLTIQLLRANIHGKPSMESPGYPSQMPTRKLILTIDVDGGFLKTRCMMDELCVSQTNYGFPIFQSQLGSVRSLTFGSASASQTSTNCDSEIPHYPTLLRDAVLVFRVSLLLRVSFIYVLFTTTVSWETAVLCPTKVGLHDETAGYDVVFVGSPSVWNFASCHIHRIFNACASGYRSGLEVTPPVQKRLATTTKTRVSYPHSSFEISVMPHTIDLGLMALVRASQLTVCL
jgi:hypothetical protein